MSENVTDKLLHELQYATPSDYTSRARRAAPAKAPLPATLQAELDRLCDPHTDRTMGYISNALAFSRAFKNPKQHTSMLRLIKGGFVDIVCIHAKPPTGSIAHHESRYSEQYYLFEPHCGL